MTKKSGLFSKLAAIMAALVVVFLPEDIFLNIQGEIIQFCGIINVVISMTGLEFVDNFMGSCKGYIKRAGKFFLAHQIIGLGDKAIDGLMVLIMLKIGLMLSILIIIPIYFVFYVVVIKVYDYFLDNGCDLLELETLKTSCKDTHGSKILRWVLRRRTTIFLIGSCFQLDPDGVTILLRKDRKNFWGNALRITLPSIIVAVVYWGTLFKLSLMGVGLLGWL